MVEGNGTVEEILACFQMLSNLLKPPFRRDSVEKIVRDSLEEDRHQTSTNATSPKSWIACGGCEGACIGRFKNANTCIGELSRGILTGKQYG